MKKRAVLNLLSTTLLTAVTALKQDVKLAWHFANIRSSKD